MGAAKQSLFVQGAVKCLILLSENTCELAHICTHACTHPSSCAPSTCKADFVKHPRVRAEYPCHS